MKLLAPFAPHWAEELWHAVLGKDGSVHTQPWPEFDPEQAKADEVELAVQVNGKVKAKIMVAADAAEDDIKAVGSPPSKRRSRARTLRRFVVVPGRLVNIRREVGRTDKAGTLRNRLGFPSRSVLEGGYREWRETMPRNRRRCRRLCDRMCICLPWRSTPNDSCPSYDRLLRQPHTILE